MPRPEQVLKLTIIGLMLAVLPISVQADEHGKPIGKGVETLPLFDAHVHYKRPAWEAFPPGTVLELMDKTGVAMALVSSTPDEGTIKLWQYAPNRIVPELRPYYGTVGSSNWTKEPGIFDYLPKRLEGYPHKGIGEFHLHRVDPDDEPLLRKIAAEAIKRDIYIHVHSGRGPVDQLFSIEPKLKIIWAHAGMSEPANVVEEMMARYERLYADTSFRETDILASNRINPDWRKVLTRFQDRFMIGTDTWVNSQWEDYEALVAINRKWLSYFPRSIAEKIAFKNAERLFGRKVTRKLIGTR